MVISAMATTCAFHSRHKIHERRMGLRRSRSRCRSVSITSPCVPIGDPGIRCNNKPAPRFAWTSDKVHLHFYIVLHLREGGGTINFRSYTKKTIEDNVVIIPMIRQGHVFSAGLYGFIFIQSRRNMTPCQTASEYMCRPQISKNDQP